MADERVCAVAGCKAKRDSALNISLHHLPKNIVVREQWIRFIGKTANSKTAVCSQHFKDECFSNLVRKKMGFVGDQILLSRHLHPPSWHLAQSYKADSSYITYSGHVELGWGGRRGAAS